MVKSTTVDQIMTREVVHVPESLSFAAIKKLFAQHTFHHLPVTDEVGALVGMISKEDLAKVNYLVSLNTSGKAYSQQTFGHLKAKDIMSKYPVFLTPNDTIELAADIFLSNKLHALPVLTDEKLVGIVSAHDLIRYAFSNKKAGSL
jgi:acetoin utilization protein AcuB